MVRTLQFGLQTLAHTPLPLQNVAQNLWLDR